MEIESPYELLGAAAFNNVAAPFSFHGDFTMATTQLADIYNPLVFNAAVDEAAIELNAFIQSGILVENPVISAMASVGGNIGELPFHNALDASGEPDYTNDNPADESTPDKITTGKMIYRLASMHKSWSTMDLTRELALMDPLGAIITKIGGWWATIKERRVIASADGLIADNVDANSSDMVVDIYSDIAVPLAANIISAAAMLDARQTAGDHQNMFTVCAMHSVTYNTLNKQNLIDFIPNARGEVDFPSYLNMRVVIDDGLTVVAGVNSAKYTTLLFMPGAFDHGDGTVMKPSAMSRVEEAGNGGGMDVLHSRSADIIHPYGYQFTSASVAGQTATLAELRGITNWTRVVERKNVGIAALLHNN